MQKIYRLSGNIPSKKNSRIITRTGLSIPGKAYMEWHDKAIEEVKLQGLVEFKKPVLIQGDFYFGDNIRRDLDNRIQSILDMFTDIGIIQDDRWQCVPEIRITGQLDRRNPHAIIKIEEL